MEGLKYGVLKMRKVENMECRKYGVLKMSSVKTTSFKHFSNTNTYFHFFSFCYIILKS